MDVTSTFDATANLAASNANSAKLSDLASNTKTVGHHTEKEIDKTAKDFEAVFITETLKPMFESVKVDPVFGGGHAEEAYRSLLLNEYGKSIANAGGFGLAAQVKKEMLHLQEVQDQKTNPLKNKPNIPDTHTNLIHGTNSAYTPLNNQ